MVIEDDPAVRETLHDLLSDEGYQVVEACNGREALDRLQSGERHPGVILLDLMMPVMDGWQFRREMRADPSLPDIPVVVMSASLTVEREAQGMSAAAVLPKPVGLDLLLATVKRLC